jgi:hypothetical protein
MSSIGCGAFLYETAPGVASVDEIVAASTLLQTQLDLAAFTLRFHVAHLFTLLLASARHALGSTLVFILFWKFELCFDLFRFV